jgi:riboflavin synthase
MFTGIIEGIGRIDSITILGGTHRIVVAASGLAQELHIGDSVAVSGVCLTTVEVTESGFSADLAEETWNRTSFSRLKERSSVNLELPLKADSRLGGHMVQGHVDDHGTLIGVESIAGAKDYWLHIEVPQQLEKYLVYKGSVAIEGISLTVARLVGNRLTIAIIPHTFEATNLQSLRPGDPINIETDILAKYLEKWTSRPAREAGLAAEFLLPTSSRFAIVVSEFNSMVTERLLAGAIETFRRSGIGRDRLEIAHVPGAYEIPLTAKLLAQTGNFMGIVCLGCLIRGETMHYELIANESARGIGQSALDTGVPHSFGVLTCNTAAEALDRAGLKGGNKGSEAAEATLSVARYKQKILTLM